jgi:hypothetical protein
MTLQVLRSSYVQEPRVHNFAKKFPNYPDKLLIYLFDYCYLHPFWFQHY